MVTLTALLPSPHTSEKWHDNDLIKDLEGTLLKQLEFTSAILSLTVSSIGYLYGESFVILAH